MEMQTRFEAMEIRMGSSSRKITVVEDHKRDEEIGCNKDQELESAKGKMGEVREENERLKLLLERLVKDYRSFQTNCFDILQQNNEDAAKTTADHSPQENEESELVSLSLGSTSKEINKDEKKKSRKSKEDEDLHEGLALGLDIRFDPSSTSADQATNITSPESVFDEDVREEEPTEIWPPSKVLKKMRNARQNIESPQQIHQLKKTRVSIRARCDTQTMHDGCQWRKYGQKMAKGNPCPRAYYRCTGFPSCPVRKQVQRCSEDMSILITTYEGTHNHPLPIAATAMVYTTSAAASMLQSPSLSTIPGLANPDTPILNSTASSNNNCNALNFSPSDIPRAKPFYFPNSSVSTSNSHPTITLDLTAPPPTSSHIGEFTSAFSSNIPIFSSSSNLNFSSTFSPLHSSFPQSPWSSTHSNYINYGTLTHNRNQGGSIINTGEQLSEGHLHHFNYMKNHPIPISSYQSLPETIAAATKAITTNPKFQSALAAALTTYVGKGAIGNVIKENQIGTGETAAALNLKLGGGNLPYKKSMVYTSTPNGGTGSASSKYLNMSSSAANFHQEGNSVLFPAPLPSPPASNKSASTSPSGKSNN